ncbi:hypothetical protein B296_00026654, partial [Ensete ventricosum]
GRGYAATVAYGQRPHLGDAHARATAAYKRWAHKRWRPASKGNGCRTQKWHSPAIAMAATCTGRDCKQRRQHLQGNGLPRPLATAAGRGSVALARRGGDRVRKGRRQHAQGLR